MKIFLFKHLTPRVIRENVFRDEKFTKELLLTPFFKVWFKNFAHFGYSPDEGATCEDCFMYLSSGCKRVRNPEDCMFDLSTMFDDFPESWQ